MAASERYRPDHSAEIVPLNSDWQVRNFTINLSSLRLDLPPLDQRRAILIKVIGPGTAFVGRAAKVAVVGADRGHPVFEGNPFTDFDPLGQDLQIFAIGDTLGIDLQLLEAA